MMNSAFLKKLRQWIAAGEVYRFYISTPWRKVREETLRHYHYECQNCKAQSPSKLTRATMVHHVRPVLAYPQYALDMFVFDGKTGEKLPQLVPLCHACHELMHDRGFPGNAEPETAAEPYPERW